MSTQDNKIPLLLSKKHIKLLRNALEHTDQNYRVEQAKDQLNTQLQAGEMYEVNISERVLEEAPGIVGEMITRREAGNKAEIAKQYRELAKELDSQLIMKGVDVQ